MIATFAAAHIVSGDSDGSAARMGRASAAASVEMGEVAEMGGGGGGGRRFRRQTRCNDLWDKPLQFLDRHNVRCTQNNKLTFLTDFKMETDCGPGDLHYKYNCQEAEGSTSRCSTHNTRPQREWNNKEVIFLDRHKVSCPNGKALSEWKAGTYRGRGRAVQVDPITPTLKAPGPKRLKLIYDGALSNFAFKFNLRRFTEASSSTRAAPFPTSTTAGNAETLQPSVGAPREAAGPTWADCILQTSSAETTRSCRSSSYSAALAATRRCDTTTGVATFPTARPRRSRRRRRLHQPPLRRRRRCRPRRRPRRRRPPPRPRPTSPWVSLPRVHWK